MKHILCSSLYNIEITDSRTPAIWTSASFILVNCHSLLRDIEDVNGSTDDADQIEEYHKHVSIAHLNTQSMSFTFDIFQVYD